MVHLLRQFTEIVVLTSARMFKNIFAGLNGFNPYTIWNRVKLLADEHFCELEYSSFSF